MKKMEEIFLTLLPRPQIRMCLSLLWENEAVLSIRYKDRCSYKQMQGLVWVMFSMQTPLKRIPTLQEIYSTVQFENEQGSTLKGRLEKWQSSSSLSLAETAS